jgi:hypothetical protein
MMYLMLLMCGISGVVVEFLVVCWLICKSDGICNRAAHVVSSSHYQTRDLPVICSWPRMFTIAVCNLPAISSC